MIWIILLSVPLGMAFMVAFPQGTIVFVVTVMILETAHLASPILLAWTKPGLRAIVCREWVKHIAAPAAVMGAVTIAPVAWVAPVYWIWNSYHFGMQNFGVAAIYGWRKLGFALLCLTMLGMSVLPLFHPNPVILGGVVGAMSFNHWITDIALSSRVSRWQWGFVAAVLALGTVWLVLRNGPLSVRLMPQVLAIRYGLGIVHFIYSGRIWRMSDPPVKAIIGGALSR